MSFSYASISFLLLFSFLNRASDDVCSTLLSVNIFIDKKKKKTSARIGDWTFKIMEACHDQRECYGIYQARL